MATGVNRGAVNPTFHGEIVAINDYVARHGNGGWDESILYTTDEGFVRITGWPGIEVRVG